MLRQIFTLFHYVFKHKKTIVIGFKMCQEKYWTYLLDYFQTYQDVILKKSP